MSEEDADVESQKKPILAVVDETAAAAEHGAWHATIRIAINKVDGLMLYILAILFSVIVYAFLGWIQSFFGFWSEMVFVVFMMVAVLVCWHAIRFQLQQLQKWVEAKEAHWSPHQNALARWIRITLLHVRDKAPDISIGTLDARATRANKKHDISVPDDIAKLDPETGTISIQMKAVHKQAQASSSKSPTTPQQGSKSSRVVRVDDTIQAM